MLRTVFVSAFMQRRYLVRRPKARTPRQPIGLGTILTTLLLALMLAAGPIALGAVRFWMELPLLGLVAILLLVQGFRLISFPPIGEVRRIDAIDLSVVLFVAYTLIRWATSPTEYFSRIETLDVIAYAAVFFTCRYGMPHRQCCMALLYLLVALGIGETVFGYTLSHYSDPTDPATQWFPFGPGEHQNLDFFPRWIGSFGSPNHYAMLLVVTITTTLALGSFSKLSWPLRSVLFYLAAMMMIGLMYSGSMGGWLALLAALIALVTFGIKNGTAPWWVPVASGLLFVVIFGIAFSNSSFVRHRLAQGGTLIETKAFDPSNRAQLISDAFSTAREHPLFGTGPGTFAFAHSRDPISALSWEGVLTHDDYLNCIDDYGLVGFAIALFFVATVTIKFFQPLYIDHRWQDRALVASGFAAWAALLVHSWFDYNLHVPANALLLFALTGLALSRIKNKGLINFNSAQLAPARPIRALGWIVVIVSLVYAAEIALIAESVNDIEKNTIRAERLSAEN
jgi:O-antigen ligase